VETGEEGPCVGFVFDSRLSRPSPEKSGYQTLAFHRISRFSRAFALCILPTTSSPLSWQKRSEGGILPSPDTSSCYP
jgi:hypothetical protein